MSLIKCRFIEFLQFYFYDVSDSTNNVKKSIDFYTVFIIGKKQDNRENYRSKLVVNEEFIKPLAFLIKEKHADFMKDKKYSEINNEILIKLVKDSITEFVKLKDSHEIHIEIREEGEDLFEKFSAKFKKDDDEFLSFIDSRIGVMLNFNRAYDLSDPNNEYYDKYEFNEENALEEMNSYRFNSDYHVCRIGDNFYQFTSTFCKKILA